MSPGGDLTLPEKRKAGYTAAAEWIASDPDNETLVFRKFDKLGALNLLYMQSEILEIEKRVDRMHHDAMYGDLELQETARRWESLVKQATEGEDDFKQDAKAKLDIIKELRVKMKEYQEALILQSKVAQLSHPHERVLTVLRHFFHRPASILLGKAKTFLYNEDDLVALKSHMEVDFLSDFLRRHLVGKMETTQDGNHYARFKESTVTRIVTVVIVCAAASFLLGPIVGLYFLRDSAARLSMVVVFTALFAVALSTITSARRAEIFGATAAYAAVVVVFVSNGSLSTA